MRLKRQFGVIVAAVFLLTACTSTYVNTGAGGTEEAHMHLQKSKAVLVTTPKDGSYGGTLYNGSGASVAQRTDTSFSRYAARVSVYPSEYHSIKELSDMIEKGSYDYIVVPTIVGWEHRATAWSGLPSRASIRIAVLDAKTGKEISSTVVEGRSASFTLLRTSPEDLLPGLIDSYVDNLYGQSSTATTE